MQKEIPVDWHKVSISEAVKLLDKGNYNSENHFCDVIESNLALVCEKVFGEKYVKHVREYELYTQNNKKPRSDFYIETDNSRILLECKTPKGRPQWGVNQLMKYILLCEANNLSIDRYVLFTTEFCKSDFDIIKRFKLPIEVYFICNEKVITLI